MNQPVFQDNILEHAEFRKCGLELLKKVATLNPSKANEDVELQNKIDKVDDVNWVI